MNFAVLQKNLDIPPVEKIRNALLTVPGFTAIDAQIFANDAFGILVKDLPFDRANLFSQALGREGVETHVVSESILPLLPQTKFIHQLDCAADGLLIYDPIGRTFLLEWQHVMMIAAGCVRVVDFKRVERPSWSTSDSEGNVYQTTTISHQEERNNRLLLEIVVNEAVLRYSVSAERFRFDYLGERRTKSLPQNFVLLVQDLASFAPNAMLNRGAFHLREDEPLTFYPSKNAFLEEIVWLLWRKSQADETN